MVVGAEDDVTSRSCGCEGTEDGGDDCAFHCEVVFKYRYYSEEVDDA